MIKKELYFGIACALTSSIGYTFVGSPVFADNPVDIRIVEMVENGSGGLKPWEDITGAMPGMTYSAIPRVQNNSSLPVTVRMCLSESATNAAGESITLPANTFQISIEGDWALDNSTATDTSDPASGNCYVYNTAIGAGDTTEPLFSEVTLSSELGNEYKDSTFNLHLYAEAMADQNTDGSVTPTNPDTGSNTSSYFDIVSPLFFAAGGVTLFAILAYILHKWHHRTSR